MLMLSKMSIFPDDINMNIITIAYFFKISSYKKSILNVEFFT